MRKLVYSLGLLTCWVVPTVLAQDRDGETLAPISDATPSAVTPVAPPLAPRQSRNILGQAMNLLVARAVSDAEAEKARIAAREEPIAPPASRYSATPSDVPNDVAAAGGVAPHPEHDLAVQTPSEPEH